MSARTAEVRRRRAMTTMVTALIMAAAYKAAPGWRQDGRGPGNTVLPASDNAPEPSRDPGKHVAEQQQHRRPDQRRQEIGYLKTPVRHLEYAGRKRHRGPQRPEKPADENARHAPLFHEGLSARQELRETRQRPHLRDVLLVSEAEPVGDPVAERRPYPAREPDRPEADAADADQRADRHQRSPGRNQQRNEGKGFAECQQQDDRRGPCLMVAHEIGERARDIFHSKRPFHSNYPV